jgi:hypothetical protein
MRNVGLFTLAKLNIWGSLAAYAVPLGILPILLTGFVGSLCFYVVIQTSEHFLMNFVIKGLIKTNATLPCKAN